MVNNVAILMRDIAENVKIKESYTILIRLKREERRILSFGHFYMVPYQNKTLLYDNMTLPNITL